MKHEVSMALHIQYKIYRVSHRVETLKFTDASDDITASFFKVEVTVTECRGIYIRGIKECHELYLGPTDANYY